MYAARYVFSSKFFSAWVVISIIWVWGTMFLAGFFPIIDGWGQISTVVKGLVGIKKQSSWGTQGPGAALVEEVPGSKGPEPKEESAYEERSV